MEVKRFLRLRTTSVMHLEEFRALQGVAGTWLRPIWVYTKCYYLWEATPFGGLSSY